VISKRLGTALVAGDTLGRLHWLEVRSSAGDHVKCVAPQAVAAGSLRGRPALADLHTMYAGWNGVPWGASLVDFRKKFPGSSRTESGWFVTGEGKENLLGYLMSAQYGFTDGGRFCMVAFYPEMGEQREMIGVRIINLFGPPDGTHLVWTDGPIQVEVKTAGIVVIIKNTDIAVS
jgi:hypothetical protein